jgi:hypothetical protein
LCDEAFEQPKKAKSAVGVDARNVAIGKPEKVGVRCDDDVPAVASSSRTSPDCSLSRDRSPHRALDRHAIPSTSDARDTNVRHAL